ncbi:MAG: DUF4238 domain-containing protein [Acidobacteria bacterium]|nr:DUF4238 domain-containing protein [Acidobacteriota bacterium]
MKLKSALHHWWPCCVSRHWTSEDGSIGWMKPDGTSLRAPPRKLGAIRNGHQIKLADRADETTAFDTDFESAFNLADSQFPDVIAWLEGLERLPRSHRSVTDRFISQPATHEQLCALTECIVSLAVRSPRNREASVARAELLSSVRLTRRRREALIGANMHSSQRIVSDAIGADAKFAVVYSESNEFIYGDGFFHNVEATVMPPQLPKIVAPVTPHITVVIARPMSYMQEPRLTTTLLNAAEVKTFNSAVQVYSREALYYRHEAPVITDDFQCARHLAYSHPDNPIDSFIRNIPGVPDRDRSMDSFIANRRT